MIFNYMMLDRLRCDCEYFLGNGNGYEDCLYYHNVEVHCDKMEELWNSFTDSEKPEWLTLDQIKGYRIQMIKKRKQSSKSA